jgi:hypothetical protein
MTPQLAKMYEQVAQLVKNGKHVTLNREELPELARALQPYYQQYLEKAIAPRTPTLHEILFTLFANSINYCFWSGRHDFYPAKGGSSLVWVAAQESLKEPNLADCIQRFRTLIQNTAMPLLPERVEMIDELAQILPPNLTEISNLFVKGANLPSLVEFLTQTFPLTYGQDPFLKRPALALQLLHEDTGFGTEVEALPIPADYQVPKVFNAWGLLKYSPELAFHVDNDVAITLGSQMEMEIRAFTIEVGRLLLEEYDIPPHVTDRFVWTQRKQYTNPFHLTVTTHY